MASSNANVNVIKAPSPIPADAKRPLIFLSGPTSNTPGIPTWHDILTQKLSEEEEKIGGNVGCTILNPLRADWDSTWKEEKDFEPFREQTEWELEGLERAYIVVVYFTAEAKAPITLLELGYVLGRLSALSKDGKKKKKVIVGCERGFWKRGNVEIICARCGVDVEEGLEGVIDRVRTETWGSVKSRQGEEGKESEVTVKRDESNDMNLRDSDRKEIVGE